MIVADGPTTRLLATVSEPFTISVPCKRWGHKIDSVRDIDHNCDADPVIKESLFRAVMTSFLLSLSKSVECVTSTTGATITALPSKARLIGG